ncbi:MAG: ferredoxin [Candidatus Omnitrophica bacterium]|nr:ferredoxin [Candidatus Omnitrophota bacterium]MBU4479258.1 ferredoxin [Candidatus Omnitrophota bacterium]MCG2703066.1 ferredoxin [Candidatus Omnitrophota bacterium]
MKTIIDKDACVGCGLCANMCADVFQMEDDKAIVAVDPIPGNLEDSAKEAASSCPVEAIKIEG